MTAGLHTVDWASIAGYASTKATIDDALAGWRHRDALRRLGVPHGAGLLLEGLSGCGKSTIAAAIAADVGVVLTPERVRGGNPDDSVRTLNDAFDRAHERGLLVLDDLDLLVGTGAADECNRRLCTELRRLLEAAAARGTFVIGCVRLATALPAGLRRAGRFDHHVTVMPPTPADRRAIVEYYAGRTSKISLADSVDLHTVAAATPLMSGADLAAIVRGAAIRAFDPQSNSIEIEQAHLLTAASHHRRAVTVVDIQRWLDAVRRWPGNESAAGSLDADLEAFKTGESALAAFDSADLLPAAHAAVDVPVPRGDRDDRRTTIVSAEPDPRWDPTPGQPVAASDRVPTRPLDAAPAEPEG